MVSEELKACPFCGSKAKDIERPDGWHYVVCCNPDCECEGLRDLGWSGAAEVWNTRPIEDALRARIAELESILAAADDILMLWECEGTMDEGASDLQEIIHKGMGK